MNFSKLITLIILFVNTFVFSQKNSFSIQKGQFHYYFDNTPIVNFKNRTDDALFLYHIFYTTTGLKYSRAISEKHTISCEVGARRNLYRNHPIKDLLGQIWLKEHILINLSVQEIKKLNHSKFSFFKAVGINYTFGANAIPVAYIERASFNETHFDSRRVHDFGLNLNLGIRYSLTNKIFLETSSMLIANVLLGGKEDIERLKTYPSLTESYKPSRFDLSLRFGIGYQF